MTESTATEIRNWTAYHLANLADCASPDNENSAGAKFLESVRDDIIEAWEYNDQTHDDDTLRDIVAQAADNAPDIYTSRMWEQFVDLAAYREDPTELGSDGSDMEQAARVCLYMIAERLGNAIATTLVEDEDGEDDDEVEG
jgi:hypothetical protein